MEKEEQYILKMETSFVTEKWSPSGNVSGLQVILIEGNIQSNLVSTGHFSSSNIWKKDNYFIDQVIHVGTQQTEMWTDTF